MLLIIRSMPFWAYSYLLASAFFMFYSIDSAAFTLRQFSITSTFQLISAISSLGLIRVSDKLAAPAICCPWMPLAAKMDYKTMCYLTLSPTSPAMAGMVSSKTCSLVISDIIWVSLILYSPSLIFCHLSPKTFEILIPSTMPAAMHLTWTTISLATKDMIPPSALQKAQSRVLSSLIKQKEPSFKVQILFIRSSSWSVPNPKLWILKTPKSLFYSRARACFSCYSAPLS